MKNYNTSTKKIFIMSLPIFLELFLQLLVGNIDQIMLSRYSQNSVAAIGNGNTIINLIIIILTMTASGGLVVMTHAIGANDEKKTAEAVTLTFIIVLIFSALATVVLIALAKPILYALNAPAEIVDEAAKYIIVVASGLTIQGVYLAAVAVLRSYSRVKEVLICAAVMNVMNVIGNYLLINGIWIFPRWGIVGAAVSTDISKAVGLALTLLFMRKYVHVKLGLRCLRPLPKETLKEILKVALPTCGESTSYNVSQIVILSFINLLGTSVITAKVYCSMLANIAYLYSSAIAQSTQINVGYMVGANDYDKIHVRVNRTTLTCIGVSVCISLALYFASDYVLGILTSDPMVIALGKQVLLIEIFLEIGRSVNIVMTRCLATLNDIYVPVAINVAMEWALAVLLGYFISIKLGYGLTGIWMAMALDEIVRGVLFQIRFSRRRWIVGHTTDTKQIPRPSHLFVALKGAILNLTK